MPPTTPSSASAPSSASKKGRARHACRVCNSRRVRCNVMEAKPCDNCVASGSACEVLPSKRGRYPRRNRQNQAAAAASTVGIPPAASPRGATEVAPQPSSPSLTRSPSRPVKQPPLHSSPGEHFRRPSRTEAGGSGTSPAGGTLFFGESNFLTLVPGDHGGAESNSAGGQRQRLMFPVPETPQSHQSPTAGTSVSAATMRYLRDEGALTLPDLQTCVPALQAYFTWFHPCFPVVDRTDFIRRLSTMDVSHLLLQAMLFIGATYCDDDTIRSMGFADRSEAKNLLYTRARMLFHADWESDGITVIQSVFLMSFWRGGPSDIRDVRYWLGVVISFAESYGLHRSEKFMSKDPRLFRIRRRIWWSIYVRERQAAASLGLPSRIRDEDCDIEPLTAADLESDGDLATAKLFGSSQQHHIIYAVKMVEVARLLGRIIDLHFVPGQQPATEDEIQDLDNSLELWKNSLPDGMQYSSDEGSASIWTCLLHLAYNHLRILIHRSSFMKFAKNNSSSQVVINAACRITRIAEDMSTQGTLRYGQMHLITSLFAALCIHTIDIRRHSGMSRRIAEHRAQLCLLCLKEIQKYWRINNTVLDLFLQYLDSSIAKRLHGSPQVASATMNDSTDVDVTTTTTAATAGDFSDAAMAPPSPTTTKAAEQSATTPVQWDPQSTRPPVGMFEDQFFNLVTGHWEGDDALGDLGLFLQGDEFMNQEGMNFLGRSL